MPLIVIVMVVIGAFFTGSELVKTQNNPAAIEKVRTLQIPTPTPTNPPTPTPTNVPQVKGESIQRDPIIDCVGPDGGHLRITQKECDSFNNAWKKPQPSNTPSVPSQTSTQTVPSSEPLVTCVFSFGTYQLTQSQCKEDQDFLEAHKQNAQRLLEQANRMQEEFKQKNQQIVQDAFDKMGEISNRKPELPSVNVVFPTPVPMKIETPYTEFFDTGCMCMRLIDRDGNVKEIINR